jgi:integrase/recombinase XerD
MYAIKKFIEFLGLQDDINTTLSGVSVAGALTEQILSKAKNPIERVALSRDEVVKLFAHSTCPRDELMLRYLYETGGRNSDVRRLTIDDIDFDKLIVEFIDSKGGKDYEVPIRKELALRTENWSNSGRQTYPGWNKHGYLFPSREMGELSRSWFTMIVRDAAEAAGIQAVLGQIADGQGETKNFYRVTPHTLRHSILTHLDDDSVPDHHRQRLAGHENRQTLQRYTHSDDTSVFELLRKEIDKK